MVRFFCLFILCFSSVIICMDDQRWIKSCIEIPHERQIDEDDFVQITAKGEVTQLMLAFAQINDGNLQFLADESRWVGKLLNSGQASIIFSTQSPCTASIVVSSDVFTQQVESNHYVDIETAVAKPKDFPILPNYNLKAAGMLGLAVLFAFQNDSSILTHKTDWLDGYTTFEEQEHQIDFTTHIPFGEYLELFQTSRGMYNTH